jgi:hypothetical protein
VGTGLFAPETEFGRVTGNNTTVLSEKKNSLKTNSSKEGQFCAMSPAVPLLCTQRRQTAKHTAQKRIFFKKIFVANIFLLN